MPHDGIIEVEPTTADSWDGGDADCTHPNARATAQSAVCPDCNAVALTTDVPDAILADDHPYRRGPRVDI